MNLISTYTYAGMSYANSDAVTQIANGVSSTTNAYDNNGNLTSSGNGTATTTYGYDYNNRLISLFAGGASTTYGYDAFGTRVLQTGTTTTYIYPNKFYSIASSTGSGATSLTKTEYIFNGDTLLSTVDNAATSTSSGSTGISTSTPAYVQSKLSVVVGGASNSVTLTNPVTSGNLIVVGITVNNQTVASNAISDNKGNTYTKASESINGLNHAAVFYAQNVTGGSSFIVSSNIGDNSLSAHEYSGIATTSAHDKTNTSTGTSATPSSGNVTTLLDNELYFGLAWSGGDGDTWTAGSGYTKREEQTNDGLNERMASEDAVLTNASTTAARFTTSSSASYAANIVTFKPLVTVTGSSGTTTIPASTQIRYIHPDHLGSTNVVTNASGTVVETLDYFPYGGLRINTGTNVSDRKFIGERYDTNTDLNYLNARYYQNSRGQFLSEDPSFLALGDPTLLKQVTGLDQKVFLTDPQLANSYSYARNNPITLRDPNGKFEVPLIWGAIEVAAEMWGAYSIGNSGGEVLNTNVLFRGDYTDSQRSDADFWGVAGALTEGEGRLAKNIAPYEKVVLNVGGDAARYIGDQFARTGSTKLYPFQQFNTWTARSSDTINPYAYSQNVAYSVNTGNPSYTGPSNGGGNSDYASKTYVLPNGKITDWGGNIIPAPPPPPPPPPAKSK